MSSASDQLRLVTERLTGGGEQRPGQIEMAEAVAETIETNEALLIEAGTGTGKSLAYLTPIVAADKRAVIATATIALQGQLVDQDVAAVADGLGRDVSVALLKGRSNYLCQQRFEEFQRSNRQERLQLLRGANEAEHVERIVEWAESTTTGDKEELDPMPPRDTWKAVSVGADECPGAARCPSGNVCFSERAREHATRADIIITNHHYYGLNISSDDVLLPEHDVVVFDEAHHMPEVIGVTNGSEVGGGRFRGVARQVKAISTDEALFAKLERTAEDFDTHLGPERGNRVDPTLELTQLLAIGRERVNEVLAILRKANPEEGSDAAARLERVRLAATRLVADLDGAIEADDSSVLWVDGSERAPLLKLTPLDVGSILMERFWGRRAAVLTSATLSEGIVPALGLDDEKHVVQRVGSPFDYPTQGLLYCPVHLPEPRSSRYREQAVAEMAELITAAGGRTLSLFTSFSAMEETAEALADLIDVPLMVQGEASRQVLLEKFRDDPATVLLATMSFWQGVDIAGPSLTLVTIDRIPFPRPDEPVSQARRDSAGPLAFRVVDLPRAQVLLAQGVGRLIRRGDDRGVVAILDSRLANKKAYRWDLIQSLPEFTRTRNLKDATDFLAELDTLHRGEQASEAALSDEASDDEGAAGEGAADEEE